VGPQKLTRGADRVEQQPWRIAGTAPAGNQQRRAPVVLLHGGARAPKSAMASDGLGGAARHAAIAAWTAEYGCVDAERETREAPVRVHHCTHVYIECTHAPGRILKDIDVYIYRHV
jgi:hypothetical protein